MPATPWRILADDLTGALDTAAAWAQADEVPVFLDRPGQSNAPVQVVSTGSRDVAPQALEHLLAPSLDWLCAEGLAFKKIDSLLRGNTLAEIACLLRSGRFDGAVFAPAFPAQGRYTAHWRHWVAPPGAPDGPRTHEHPETLDQALGAVGLRPWRPARPADSMQRPGEVAVPDVLDEQVLAQLAALAHGPEGRRWLWCGSAGLAWALARHEAAAWSEAGTVAAAPAGPLVLLTASRHPVLRAQLRALLAQPHGVEVLDWAQPQALPPAQAQAALDSRARAFAARAQAPGTLLVVGGDTLLALCRAAGVQGLIALPSPRPGWGHARLLGGPWQGLNCYTRSGAFGLPDDLGELLHTLGIKETA